MVKFVGSSGTKTVSGETCRTIFYSSTYKKSVTSMRFDINGKNGGVWTSEGVVTSGGQLASLDGAAVISGNGEIGILQGASAAAVT